MVPSMFSEFLCGIYCIVIGNADEVLKDPEQAFCSVRINLKGSEVHTATDLTSCQPSRK